MTREWQSNLLKAVEAQAQDETLWCMNPSDWQTNPPEHIVTIGEAYMQQSLRWLHRVIEENDLEALKCILNQAKGEI